MPLDPHKWHHSNTICCSYATLNHTSDTSVTAPTPSMALGALTRQLTRGFHSLHGAPPQLWVVYALKLLESYNYFRYSTRSSDTYTALQCQPFSLRTLTPPRSLAVSFTLYLTEDFGIRLLALRVVVLRALLLRIQ